MMKKYIQNLKRSITAILTITLLLNSFYAFSMLPKKNRYEMKEIVIHIPSRAENRTENLDETSYESNDESEMKETVIHIPSSTEDDYSDDDVEDLSEILPETVVDKPEIENRGRRKLIEIPGKLRVTDLPKDCTGVILEFLSDNFEDVVNFMSKHTYIYLLGLKCLSRLNTKIKIKIPAGPLIKVMDFDKSIDEEQVVFYRFEFNRCAWESKLKTLNAAKNYLEDMLRKLFFNNRRINQKMKREYYRRGSRKKFDQLIALVNEKIIQNLTYNLVDNETNDETTFIYQMNIKELDETTCEIRHKIRKMEKSACKCMSLYTSMATTCIIFCALCCMGILAAIATPIGFRVKSILDKYNTRIEIGSATCRTTRENYIGLGDFLYGPYTGPYDRLNFKCYYNDNFIGYSTDMTTIGLDARIVESFEICTLLDNLCETNSTQLNTERCGPLQKLCSGAGKTFSKVCREITQFNETQLSNSGEACQQMNQRCRQICTENHYYHDDRWPSTDRFRTHYVGPNEPYLFDYDDKLLHGFCTDEATGTENQEGSYEPEESEVPDLE